MKVRSIVRNRYFFLVDLVFIVICILGSYVLRLELDQNFYQYLPSTLWMIGVSLLIKPLVYYFFGLYRRIWLYAGIQELKIIAVAVTTASILISLTMMVLFIFGVFTAFPRSIPAIDGMLSILAVGGTRFALRLLHESRIITSSGIKTRTKQVLIIGAGDAGALVLRELQRNPQLSIVPVGFLDDNPQKQQQQIYGVPIIGTLTDLSRILNEQHVDEVIIAIPSAPGRVMRLVADVCRRKSTPFRTVPGMYELIGGKVAINRLREVDITDLLRREPSQTSSEKIGATFRGKTILVTGAGGSIGKEICRQIATWEPAEILLLGHGENSIFEALMELRENFPSLNIRPIIADIRDKNRIHSIFVQHHPQVVFHAAAHKHVPLMEINIEEAITNNIQGTRVIVQEAAAQQVERLVMISTDKAIRPVNIMGATKHIAEMIVLDTAIRSRLPFSVVRFGNVLGSRGSVVPIFKRQIAKGGPITITHPDMQRYFMTIPEAVCLVLQAASMGEGGETYVLNMGQQIRILDMAEDLIRLSGLEPGKDIGIVFTGVRPGEKLKEDLWDEGYTFQTTSHPDIFQLDEHEELSGEALDQAVNEIIHLAYEGDTTSVLKLLDEIIPNAAVVSTPPPDMNAIS